MSVLKSLPCFFRPQVWIICVTWGLHALLLSVILRTMSLPASVPWVEVFAYTGYSYVPACIIIGAGILGGEEAEERGG